MVDEDVVQPIESPRLDWEYRGADARLNERNGPLPERVQERAPGP
jgi:hypothetical protein